jgi:hypothetical protein
MASFTQLPSGNWRVQVRRKDGEEWGLEIESNIDRSGSDHPNREQRKRSAHSAIS